MRTATGSGCWREIEHRFSVQALLRRRAYGNPALACPTVRCSRHSGAPPLRTPVSFESGPRIANLNGENKDHKTTRRPNLQGIMNKNKCKTIVALLGICFTTFTLLGIFSLPAQADVSYPKLVVFGDSLSDDGNLLLFTQGAVPPDPPYWRGRYSNGLVWPEYIAVNLGIPVENIAYGGAQSGGNTSIYDGEISGSNYPSLPEEVAGYLSVKGNPFTAEEDLNALYIVWAGANDLLDPGNTSRLDSARGKAVEGIAEAVSNLLAAGAQRILVGMMPDLGLIPYASLGSTPSPKRLTQLSESFNRDLLDAIEPFGAGVTGFDSLALHRAAVASPGSYGFTNVTTSCLSFNPCRNNPSVQDFYLFWDDRHPTTAAHRLLAQLVAEAAASPSYGPAEQRLDRADSFGLFNPSTGRYILRNDRIPGPPDYVPLVTSPSPATSPLAGDWNGDRTDTVGYYDPVAGVFALSDDNETGSGLNEFRYGPIGSSWTPLAGDWDGDGKFSIGLYDADRGLFHLRDSNSSGRANYIFRYGPIAALWLPLAGDWDGDGRYSVGLFDPTTATFHLRNSNSAGAADVAIRYGPAAGQWRPIVGDWNGDGSTTVGLYDPVDGRFHLRKTNTGGPADIISQFGPAQSGWMPVAGDWNGRLLPIP